MFAVMFRHVAATPHSHQIAAGTRSTIDMAISLPQLRQRLTPSFNIGAGLQRMLEPLAVRQPLVYRGVVALFGLLGYALLALFPLTALLILTDLPRQLQLVSQWQDGLHIAVALLVAVLTGILSVPLFRNRFALPRGMPVNQQNAPRLYREVEQLRQEFKYPVIDQILLREGFTVEIIKTPRFGLPLLYHNTLVIGLDALLSLPPGHFKSLLVRRIGQLSGLHNRLIHWLASLRSIWRLYHQAFRQQKSLLAKPLQFLFGLYAPFYAALSFYISRQDELEADRYAQEIANDEEIASLFSQLIVTETFLKTKFWPKITQLARRQGGSPEHLPYASLTPVLRRGLNREDMQEWLKNAFEITSDVRHSAPLLQQRLENIGHHKPASPRALHQTAADEYVDPAVLQKIIDKFDQLWLAKLK